MPMALHSAVHWNFILSFEGKILKQAGIVAVMFVAVTCSGKLYVYEIFLAREKLV